MNIKSNFCALVKAAHRYQYVKITDNYDNNKSKPIFYFTFLQIMIIIVSILISLFTKEGINSNFAGFIISALSLFVGIFFTFLLTLYDKFKNIDFSKYLKTKDIYENTKGIKLKNFFKKITVLSLYAVVLCIVSIILLGATFIFSELNVPTFIINKLKAVENPCDFLLIQTITLKIYKVVTFYFLFDIILITFYLITSFYDFLISEYDSVKLSKL